MTLWLWLGYGLHSYYGTRLKLSSGLGLGYLCRLGFSRFYFGHQGYHLIGRQLLDQAMTRRTPRVGVGVGVRVRVRVRVRVTVG